MAQLTFYGGINEIGGNKILLEDGSHRLFLDFGFPYKRHKQFYEEYLRPRGGAGLLDPLVMGLLPPLEGVYREDMAVPELWPRFRALPHYRKLDSVDGILLTHAHLDHSGHISFIDESVPVYATATTAFITKAIQDSGKSDFDQQVCYFDPKIFECLPDWKQPACFTAKASAKQQRQFCIVDVKPDSLSTEALAFWADGFWEKTARQKGMDSYPLTNPQPGGLNIRSFPVDHSILGACAWGIETSSGWVIYSGDLRLHGKRTGLTSRFIEEASRLHPRALILEGTNITRSSNISEQNVYENSLKAIKNSDGLVIADFSARDIDRLLTFLNIARETGRKLAVLPKDAYLLKTLRLVDSQIPDIAHEPAIAIYQDTSASRTPAQWLKHIYEDYASQVVIASDVGSNQDHFVLCFSFFDLNELPSIRPSPGSIYVFSSSEPHDEEQEIDFRRLHEWLKFFGIKGIGLPLETNGEWSIPEIERGLHASGHACGSDLFDIARQINAEILIPVHSEKPELYREATKGANIKVVLPELYQPVTI